MPTYVYECEVCGHRYEKFQPITADSIDECEKCGGRAKRIITGGAGIIFKGSGFYVTDYKKKEEKSKQETKPKENKNNTDKS
jgi:putative FmdB family regulatory protein